MTADPLVLLIVDDSKLVRLTLKKKLKSVGFEQFHEAASGADALLLLEQEQAANLSVVLTDKEMPGMNGLELTQEIRARPIGTSLTVLLVTGHDLTPEQIEEVRQAGVDGYLDKGSSAETMKTEIFKCIQARSGA